MREVPGIELRVGEDFERDGVVFRAGRESSRGFRIFFSHEFLSDTPIDLVDDALRKWNVATQATDLAQGSTLFVVSEGTFAERTEGQTLRDSSLRFAAVLPPSTALASLYNRVFAVPVDGVPLGDIPSEMQGDPDLYITFSQDFANALGAAYLLDGAGYRNFAINTTKNAADEGVDFEVHLDSGEVAYLEFKRAITSVERRINALREQANIGLRSALRDRPDLATAIEGRFIQITLPSMPPSKGEVGSLVEEIIRFVMAREWLTHDDGSMVPFDEDHYPMLSKLGAQVYLATGPTHLSVTEGGKSFDRHAPYRMARQIIMRCRGQRFNISPVWLGISLADTLILPSSEELTSLIRSIDQIPNPFAKIIIGSAEGAAVWPHR
jgi:hypothetical protein